MKYRGRVEAFQEGNITGWCVVEDARHRAPFVSVFDGDQLVGTAKVGPYRQDPLHIDGDDYHGFSFPIPDHLADGRVHLLSVFAGPGVDELAGSPVRVRLEKESPASQTISKSEKQYRPKRAAIVCWDLSHNPVGRAYIMYKLLEPDWDVEIAGPIWQRFGNDLWAPLRNEALTIKCFQPTGLTDLWCEGAKLALTQAYDLVIVCKPRLPGLILGLQIAEQSCCPMIVDIDEDERAFSSPQSNDGELIKAPFATTGTNLAHKYLHVADAITVSNPTLQEHFAGRVVRHARDESVPRVDRKKARSRFGLTDADFAIAFVGTARSHKGLSHVLSALKGSADRSVKLLLAGSVPNEIDREIKLSGLTERVIRHDEFDFSELGGFLAAADLVPLLQDPDSLIAQTQMPAKFVDALQYGVRIVASDTPPFREMRERGVVDLIESGELAEYLAKIRTQPQQDGLGDHRRRIFEGEFSFAVNRPRLALAIEAAFAHFDPVGSNIKSALQELLAETRTAGAVKNGSQLTPNPRISRNGRDSLDIAFFWKQNDSDLFGRRSDMIVKYLLMSERVGTIVHFDRAASLSDLRRMANAEKQRGRSLDAMQLDRTVARTLELVDEERLKRRLFIRSEGRSSFGGFAGRQAATDDRHDEFVAGALRAAGLDPTGTVAWVCPVVQGFTKLNERLGFRKIIVDLIDDQRTWESCSEADQAAIHKQYEDTLRMADLVFTNCEGNRQRFAWARADMIVIPNGTEIRSEREPLMVPEQLRALRRPIVGYVGNLRDRIDWELLRILADRRPSWSFVLAGPVEDDRLPDWVTNRPNLFFPGPVPYEASRSWMRSFDVAIVPHLKSQMTASMNPLKLYNYLAAGVPVVTTPVSNIDEVMDLVCIRDTPADFIEAIESLLSSPRPDIPSGRLESFSWERRVKAMLDAIDGLF